MSIWVGIDRTDQPCTNSTSYIDMPGTSLTFDTTTFHQRVLILFQGEWFNNDRALIRAVVDGNVVSGPGDGSSPMAVDSGNDDGGQVDETNGFNFISDDILAGFHTAKIQWASVSDGSICVDERSLIVQSGP